MNHRDISFTLGCSLLLLMTYPVVKSVIMLRSGFFAIESSANGVLAGYLVTGLFSTLLGACVSQRALLYGACAGLLPTIIIVVGLPVAMKYFWGEYGVIGGIFICLGLFGIQGKTALVLPEGAVKYRFPLRFSHFLNNLSRNS